MNYKNKIFKPTKSLHAGKLVIFWTPNYNSVLTLSSNNFFFCILNVISDFIDVIKFSIYLANQFYELAELTYIFICEVFNKYFVPYLVSNLKGISLHYS